MASITKYVKEHFFETIKEIGEFYIFLYHTEFHSFNKEEINSIEIEHSSIQKVYAGEREDGKLDFDVLLNIFAVFNLNTSSQGIISQKKVLTLKFSCIGSANQGIQDFQIQSIGKYDANNFKNFTKPLTDELIPYISKKNLDDIAEELLSEYFPEALKTPTKLDSYSFAKALGLNVQFDELSSNTSIFGRLHFHEDEFSGIPAKTIVIDKNIKSKSMINSTIIHECLHWILHKYSAELEKASPTHKCKLTSSNEFTENEAKEWQVHNLVPMLMMPTKTTKTFIKKRYHEICGNSQPPEMIDIIEQLIKDTANFFGTTIVATKNRLYGFGIEEARGALNYIDGKYVPPHSWKKGFLGPKQTFSIGFHDLAQLLSKHDLLGKLFLEGKFIYIDSHICLNLPKYIEALEDNKLSMTYYARTHMDECCLVFEKDHKYNIDGFVFYFGSSTALNNSIDTNKRQQYYYDSSDNNLDLEIRAAMLNAEAKESADILNNLPFDFGSAISYLRERKKMSVEDLEASALISQRTIYSLQKNAKEPKLQTIVALCIALTLPYPVSVKLMEIAGRSLRQSSIEEMIYAEFLQKSYELSVEDCNQMLTNLNYSILTTKTSL